MTLRILAAASPGEVRVAVLHDDALLDYAIWRPGAPDGVGDLHRGRVMARVAAMAGSFLALDGAEGFLPDSEGGAGLHEGDLVSVRVTRAAQGGKGPRLTARLAPDEVRCRRVAQAHCWNWRDRYPDAPVLVDDSALAARLKPALGDRVEVVRQGLRRRGRGAGRGAGATRCGPAQRRPAAYPSDAGAGGHRRRRGWRIGRRGRGRWPSHLAANLAVLPVLARQIRLRNLSGAILVDFAGLPARRRMALAPALHAALAEDPLRPRLLGFTALGLAEIVRPRVHPPLHELLAGPHAAGLAALRCIAAEVASPPHRMPALRASPAIVAALRGDAEALADLARRAGRALILRSDPNLPATAWTIEASDG